VVLLLSAKQATSIGINGKAVHSLGETDSVVSEWCHTLPCHSASGICQASRIALVEYGRSKMDYSKLCVNDCQSVFIEDV
jgi:hypothetical protein